MKPAVWFRRSALSLATLLALVVASGWYGTLSNSAQHQAVMAASTNIANLGQGHFGTLITSAFLGMGSSPWWWLVVGAALLATEWRWGAKRLVAIAAAGQVGASLLVAAGIELGEMLHVVPEATAHAPDVGFSYAVMGLLGGLTLAWRRRWLAAAWLAGWTTYLGYHLVESRTFTDFGHLVALAMGVGTAAWLAHRAAQPSASRASWAARLRRSSFCIAVSGSSSTRRTASGSL